MKVYRVLGGHQQKLKGISVLVQTMKELTWGCLVLPKVLDGLDFLLNIWPERHITLICDKLVPERF